MSKLKQNKNERENDDRHVVMNKFMQKFFDLREKNLQIETNLYKIVTLNKM